MGTLTETDWSSVDLDNIEYFYGSMREQVGETVARVADERFVDRMEVPLMQMFSDPELQREWLREVAAVAEEAAVLIEDGVSKVKIGNSGIRYAWEWYEEEFDGDPVAWVSELLGGAESVSRVEFDLVDTMLAGVKTPLEHDHIAFAAESLVSAAEYYDQVEDRWRRFIEDARSGAQVAITSLEITRDVSFTVAAAIATGGTTGALGITSTLGKAAVGAGVSMAGRTVQAGATGLGHVLAGTTEDFEVTDELVETIKSGGGGFAGGVVSGWAGKLTEKLGGRLTTALTPYLGQQASSWSTHVLRLAVDEGAGSVAETIAGLGIDSAAGKRFGSTEELLDYLTDEFVENYWQNMVDGAVSDAAHSSTPAIGAIDTDALQRSISAAFR
jgi:hypothetical protein